VVNSSFEVPAVSGFAYGPSIAGTPTGMTFNNQSGLARYGGPFGFLPSPDGNQVAFLNSDVNGAGIVTQGVSGLVSGVAYVVNFRAAARPGYTGAPITVRVGGVSLGTYTPPGSFTAYTSAPFTAVGASATIEWAAGASGPYIASGIDLVTVTSTGGSPAGSPGSMSDPSFEQPYQGSGFTYQPSGSPGNTFGVYAGLAGNGSAWSFPTAPLGNQVAFLQGNSGATVSILVSGLSPSASYTVKFKASKRQYFPANQLQVAFNGTQLGTFSPGAVAFQQFTSLSFTAGASSGTLTFTGLTAGDSGTGIDDIQVTSP
jgi:hypothetical protein